MNGRKGRSANRKMLKRRIGRLDDEEQKSVNTVDGMNPEKSQIREAEVEADFCLRPRDGN